MMPQREGGGQQFDGSQQQRQGSQGFQSTPRPQLQPQLQPRPQPLSEWQHWVQQRQGSQGFQLTPRPQLQPQLQPRPQPLSEWQHWAQQRQGSQGFQSTPHPQLQPQLQPRPQPLSEWQHWVQQRQGSQGFQSTPHPQLQPQLQPRPQPLSESQHWAQQRQGSQGFQSTPRPQLQPQLQPRPQPLSESQHWAQQQQSQPQLHHRQQQQQAQERQFNQKIQQSVGQDDSSVDAQRQEQNSRKQRWILFLRHASSCTAPEGQCEITPNCLVARQLWAHMESCRDPQCTFNRCYRSRILLRHCRQCRDAQCPICGPVRRYIMNERRLQANSPAAQQRGQVGAPSNSVTPGLTTSSILSPSGIESSPTCNVPVSEELDVQRPPAKLVIIEPPSGSNLPSASPSGPSESGAITATPAQIAARSQAVISKSEQVALKLEITAGLGPLKRNSESVETATPANASTTISTTTGKRKNCGASLTELFTPEQICEHIKGLRQCVSQSKAKAVKNQATEHQTSENACRLCAVEKLTLEPPPIYCTACAARIKRNAIYYTTSSGYIRHYFCVACYTLARSEDVEVEGTNYPKSELEKKKNDEETEEAWVQCDKCNLWHHQICALFNGRRNEGDSEYTCPECCRTEMERGERKPLPSSAILSARDLPKTFLSDLLEQRLSRKLKRERAERAKAQGTSVDEVPSAEALVVRVVSSVDKKLQVKQRFLEIFQEEDYPTEYPYKSKAVLLFQKIQGAEVCLFGMYVHEFGVESSLPNQRRVYLSYLDSVKYFRPDIRTINGEALRTFVYHEILIGYLDHCQRRGFCSCYIWACPPLKGEDYIWYCHPETQKTPKSDKLRDWYMTMLRKASNERIAVEITNLYDYFFASTGECKAKVTAARLPYFDGDYWPCVAEDMIVRLQQEEEDPRKNALKKGKTKKPVPKRFQKELAQVESASNASINTQLMQKLGENIHPMKEDFIIVHLQHACSHCRLFIVNGHRWVCKQCIAFQLCDKCNSAEQKLDVRNRHPVNTRGLHTLQPVEVNDVPSDTRDRDEIMESEFFDTRQAFLSLCQGNRYQYDTLRRAKHSSMMVVYHLHNPTAPAFVASCNFCHLDIATGSGWRCETCADFDLCNNCKDEANHPHRLAPDHDRTAQNKEASEQRILQLRNMLDLLVHASQCESGTCRYPKCRNVKVLFRHGTNCRIRYLGGCRQCIRMWYLLQLHARSCKETGCRVPRCKDLKEHMRWLNQHTESRRRVAVKEMMRQRLQSGSNYS